MAVESRSAAVETAALAAGVKRRRVRTPRTPSGANGRMRGWLPRDRLRAFARTLTRADLAEIAAYVVLSLGSALAGSLAAVLLVPLVQPGHFSMFGNDVPGMPASIASDAAIFTAATAIFAIVRWLVARLGARLVGRYGMARRGDVHARLIDAPLAALPESKSAEIANVLTYNVEIITQGFSAVLQLLIAAVTSAVSLGFAIWVSPRLMLMAPVLFGFGLFASRAFGREQSRVSRAYIADFTSLFRLSEDFPRRLRLFRSFGREKSEKADYAAIAARLCDGYRRQVELTATGRLVLELLAGVCIAALFAIADLWHGIDRPSLIAVCLLLGRLLPYLVTTRQSFQTLRTAVPAFELWQGYMGLDSASLPADPPRAAAAGGALNIERMRLTAPPTNLEVDRLSLVPGELTLISGDSGIGKSSLVDVLAGMVRPAVFTARMGEKPFGFDEYRAFVRKGAYISQSIRPWQRSVRECLQWARPGAGDRMMRDALVDIGLDRRLSDSPRGLDTPLHGTSNRFSGGELQRLLLAQVILRQPLLALLDEATSALDAASEIAVLSALKQRLPDTILVVVSHRARVAALADQCLILGSGPAGAVTGKVEWRRVRH